ncbi:ribose 5-phosphate isomerase B [Gymnodinialimonas ulvae]|uniref:ribose 5-phosphate isomerase B n=1 Tax=Gymnodinialimonas ulvae TaxID=3126504 RepID=UPI00309E8B3C
MRIAIGCDEAGFELKELLKGHIEALGHRVVDFGVKADETVLYPDIAVDVAREVVSGNHDRAVLICGTGIGVCISANKVRGIRAAQAHDTYSAERAQKSNDAQILCIGARIVGPELAKSIVSSFLNASFESGRSGPKVDRIRHHEEAARVAG